jgi:diamine N-acetyltransferase
MTHVSDHVELREITAATVRTITSLVVAPQQRCFVATNAESLAQALFAPEAWYRAIYHANEPVGFVMLSDESLRHPPPASPEIWVWRFMVDIRYQRKGIGRAALHLVVEHVRSKKLFERLLLSYVPGEGSPERLYRSLGFQPTGAIEDGEVVMALNLNASAA